MKNYFKVGKLVATHGLSGELVLKHSLGKKTSLKGIEAIFVEEQKDNFLPYFISSGRIKSDTEVLLTVEGFTTKEASKKLVQKEVWLLEVDFKKYAGKSAPISLLGLIMINEDEELGEILEVIEQPHQVLCRILYHGNDALIPVHEEFLEKIDQKNKKVYVTLPDGLLEIYKA